jgi:hypothetical protein
MASDTQ